MRRLLTLIFFIASLSCLHAQVFVVDTLYYHGDVDNRINLLILGDGYQASEIGKFRSDALNVANYFFSISPYNTYKNFFNVFAVEVVSVESGASHPGTASDEVPGAQPIETINNYLKTSFDQLGIHRCVLSTQSAKVYAVANQNVPGWDFINVIINTPYYGGCTSGIAYTSITSDSPEVFAHEFGHMFGLLSDEYDYGSTNCVPGVHQQYNVSQQTDTSILAWKNWLTTSVIPTPNGTLCGNIGLYEGANSCSSNWYRPKCDCKMRTLYKPYCEICIEQLIYRISSRINYIEDYSPLSSNVNLCQSDQQLFTSNVLNNSDSTIRTQWFVDNVLVENNNSNFIFNASGFTPGNHQLKISAYDTTLKARKPLREYHHIWNINILHAAISSPDSVIFCDGDSSVLKASYGGNYTYQWLKNNVVMAATDSVLMVQSTGNYSVIVSNGICQDTSSQIHVEVKHSPVAYINLLGNDTICWLEPVVLSTSICNTCELQWKFNGVNIPSQYYDSIYADTTGTYALVVTDTASGCVSSDKIKIFSALMYDITANLTAATVCEGDSELLYVDFNATDYQWYKDSILLPGKTNDSIIVNATGNYYAKVSMGPCFGWTNNLNVVFHPVPVVSFSGLPDSMCVYDSPVALSGDPQGGLFLSPIINGNIFDPATVSPGLHTITYEYFDQYDCGGDFSKDVFVDVCLGTRNIKSNYDILIFPNPSKGLITIKNNLLVNESVTIRIIDLPGTFIKSFLSNEVIASKSSIVIDCSELQAGAYLIQINSSKGSYMNRLMIVK